jgi:hypothetical protein
MRITKRNIFSIALGVLVIAATSAIFYLLPYPKQTIDRITYLGLLIAEILIPLLKKFTTFW